MNRSSWIAVIAIIGYSFCAMFAFGYNAGEKHKEKYFWDNMTKAGIELIKLPTGEEAMYIPSIAYEYDPNSDPKYQELREKGYRWEDKRGWVRK